MASEFLKIFKEGQILLNMGNHSAAAEKYQQSLKLAQNDSEKFGALISWGAALERQEKYEDAIEKFKAAESFAGNPEEKFLVFARLGAVLGIEEKHEDAMEQFRLAESFAKKPEEKFESIINWGTALNAQEKYEEAIEKFKLAESFMRSDQDKFKLHFNWGNAFFGQKKDEDAIRKFKLAEGFAQSSRDKFESLFNWGASLTRQVKYEKAIEKFKLAEGFAENPEKKFMIFLNWGSVLFLQKKYKEAIEKYKLAEGNSSSVNPKKEKENKVRVFYSLFRAYQFNKKLKEAGEYWKKTNEIDANFIPFEQSEEFRNELERQKEKVNFEAPLGQLNDSSYPSKSSDSENEYERLKQKRMDSRFLGWFFKFLYWSPELFSTAVTLLIISFVIGWQLFSGHSWKVSFQSAPFIVLFALVLVIILRDFTKTGFVYEEKRWKWILIGLIGFSFISLEEQFLESVKTTEGLVETSTESVKVSEASVKTPEGLVKRSKESVETSEASNLLLGKSIEYWQLHLLLIFAISFSAWQYLTAKRLRIDTQNRIAMARMLMANQTMFKDQETRDANNSQIVRIVAKNVFKKEGSPAVELKTPVVSAKANI